MARLRYRRLLLVSWMILGFMVLLETFRMLEGLSVDMLDGLNAEEIEKRLPLSCYEYGIADSRIGDFEVFIGY